MRVLITGGAGFIGRHLVHHLLSETKWDITILDRLGEGAALGLFNAKGFSDDRVKFHWHDLKAPITNLPGHFRYIIHLAAGSHVDRSIKDPLGFVADNVTGTAHMLEFARKVEGLEKFLHFSTDEVFGAANGKAFDEYDSFYPTNPYSASKAAAEALCPAWANTFGLPIVVTRCTNVAGPGQDGEKFIPSTIAKVGRGEVVQIHSRNGAASSRKYIDVQDVCAATITALTRGGVISGRGSGYYNIAGETEYSNVDVAARIAELMGKTLAWELVEDPPNRPRPDLRYDLDNTRLKGLGWEQRVPLEATLKEILRCG
jgi:dTDP-glucose 4,6-dehydratase